MIGVSVIPIILNGKSSSSRISLQVFQISSETAYVIMKNCEGSFTQRIMPQITLFLSKTVRSRIPTSYIIFCNVLIGVNGSTRGKIKTE